MVMRPRIPNNGPEMRLADLSFLLPLFVEYNSRSVAGQEYEITTSSGPVLTTLAAQSVAIPTETAPEGYEWALRAEFTGNMELLAPSTNTLFVLQLQVDDGASGNEPLAEGESGSVVSQYLTASVPAVGEYESISVHATRTLASLPDPEQAARIVRVAWGIQGTGSSVRFQSSDEDETGGWDLTVKWVLEPVPVV